jgi:hypothetical protein
MSNDDSNKPGGLLSHLAGGGPLGMQAPAQGLRTPPPPLPPPNLGLRAPPPPPGALGQIFGRPTVQGLYYNGKMVALDGYQFVGCRFDNCTLMVASPNFELINCVIDPSTVIQYGMETVKIVRLFNSRSEWMYASAPGLAPRRNADGTITIDGMPNE